MGMAAMIGPTRISRILLRQVVRKVRDVRPVSSMSHYNERYYEVLGGPQKGTFNRSFFTSRMMSSDEVKLIECPAFADSISEGDIRWEKAVGDTVEVDEVICEIETDKTSVPVPSPVAGVIQELLVEDGSTVSPGTKLLKIKVGGGGDVPAAAPAPTATVPAPTPPPAAPAAAAPAPPPP